MHTLRLGVLFAIALLLGPGVALAHGGGLNAEGCHNNHKTGGYHCHRAPGWRDGASGSGSGKSSGLSGASRPGGSTGRPNTPYKPGPGMTPVTNPQTGELNPEWRITSPAAPNPPPVAQTIAEPGDRSNFAGVIFAFFFALGAFAVVVVIVKDHSPKSRLAALVPPVVDHVHVTATALASVLKCIAAADRHVSGSERAECIRIFCESFPDRPDIVNRAGEYFDAARPHEAFRAVEHLGQLPPSAIHAAMEYCDRMTVADGKRTKKEGEVADALKWALRETLRHRGLAT